METQEGHVFDRPRSRRSSMQSYTLSHRRTGSTDNAWRKDDDERMNRVSMDFADSRRSSRNNGWSRNRVSRGSFAFEEEDSDNSVSIPSTPSTRYSNYQAPDFLKRHSAMDKLGTMLENLTHDPLHEDGPHHREDWESLLRQYDRYDEPTETNTNRRRSKCVSRFGAEQLGDTPGKFFNYNVMCVNVRGSEVPAVDSPTMILDCYDFPSAFKTHHLQDIFREYEHARGGYRIKWLTDTRALIIFSHPATAKKAYLDNVTNTLATIRPYEGPTDFLKSLGSRPTSTSPSFSHTTSNGTNGTPPSAR